MLPLVDMHCHLLAGLDDGPATMEEALDMCAVAHAEGVRSWRPALTKTNAGKR